MEKNFIIIDNDTNLETTQINNDLEVGINQIDNDTNLETTQINNDLEVGINAESCTAYTKVKTLKNLTMGDLKNMTMADLLYVSNK